MYSLYLEDSTIQSEKGSYSTYRDVFKSMNLGFHRPKKDKCSLCMSYREGDDVTKQRLESKYTKHVEQKEKIRAIKKESKIHAKDSRNRHASAVFDLQQVISLPKSKENAVYYKRRLSLYNFTIYNLATKDCHCFKWHEGLGQRGSSEISTCVHNYLQILDSKGFKTVDLFADGCSGQNRNSIMATMLLYTVVNSINIEEISLKFFEPHHGQSEGDSAHSAISYAIQNAGDIFVPAQIATTIILARRSQPYVLHDLSFQDFLDFKDLSKNIRLLTIRKDNESGDTIDWTQICEYKVVKAYPDTIFFKKSHLDSNYRSLSIKRQNNNKLRERVNQVYSQPPKLSRDKYNDLMSLCQGDTPVIRREEYVQFYQALPH